MAVDGQLRNRRRDFVAIMHFFKAAAFLCPAALVVAAAVPTTEHEVEDSFDKSREPTILWQSTCPFEEAMSLLLILTFNR